MAQVDTSSYNLLGNIKSIPEYQNAFAQAQTSQAALQDLPIQAQLLRAQLDSANIDSQRKAQMFNLLGPLLQRMSSGQSGGGSSPAADGSAPTGGGVGGVASGGSGGGSPAGLPLSFQDVVALKLAGGPDLSGDFKMGLEGVSRAPGAEVTDVNGRRRMIPKLAEGQQLNPDGSIGNIPGAVGAAADAAGATTAAQEREKAKTTLLPLGYVGTDGVPIGGSVAGYLGAQPAPPAAGPSGGSDAFSQFSPQQRALILASMQRNGDQTAMVGKQQPGAPLATTDQIRAGTAPGVATGQITPQGQPDVAAMQQQMQQQLDAAKRAGAEGLARFQAQYLPHILAIPDPTQRADALSRLTASLQSPVGTPIPTQGPQQGPPALQSPVAAETAKATALAGVKAATEPGIEYGTKVAADAAAYKAALDSTVTNGQSLMLRVAESRDALQNFTPGMGAEARLTAARAAQALGMPDSLVQKINDGDVAAKQEFMKLSAQTAMESLKQAMGSSGRITQAEFKVFQQNNPNIELDPKAIDKIYDFATRVYQNGYKEQQARAAYVQGGGNPAEWPAVWTKQMDPAGAGVIGGSKTKGWTYVGPAGSK